MSQCSRDMREGMNWCTEVAVWTSSRHFSMHGINSVSGKLYQLKTVTITGCTRTDEWTNQNVHLERVFVRTFTEQWMWQTTI